MPTYRIDLSWEGTAYCGWQVQPKQRSIQSEVERAVSSLFGGEKITVNAAGRTDAGVHALQQVASFQSQNIREPSQIVRALNSMLPKDIVCLSAFLVSEHFHARTISKSKLYRYRILYRQLPCPFRYNHSWHINYPLQIEQMKEAAALFSGTHDFQAFRANGCSAKTTIRTLFDARLFEKEDELHFEIAGKGFLRHQVRIMLGTLVDVGRGKMQPTDIKRALEKHDRSLAGQTAPSHGLWLVSTSLLDKEDETE